LAKSGGIATNIGIHFFDMLLWLFGGVRENRLHVSTPQTASGYLELERADVRWLLSIDAETLPSEAKAKKQRTYRSIRIDDQELEFSEGFTDLHTATYRDILAGGGFGVSDARPAIQLAHDMRVRAPHLDVTCAHPFLQTTRDAE
jgi:UDP-N-acetyl-2-amino-2-deoxyglucuronate dehydrogenase